MLNVLVTDAAFDGESSNGRTADFDSVNGGSNPPSPMKLASIFTTRQEWRRRLYASFSGRCCYCGCGTVLNGEQGLQTLATVDHLIPRSQGGKHSYANLILACLRCNSARGDSDFATYMAFWHAVDGAFCWWPNRRAQSRYRRRGKHAPFHVKKPPMTPNPKPAEALG